MAASHGTTRPRYHCGLGGYFSAAQRHAVVWRRLFPAFTDTMCLMEVRRIPPDLGTDARSPAATDTRPYNIHFAPGYWS
jgi:hypothetical protein